jgi:hypothetical protein
MENIYLFMLVALVCFYASIDIVVGVAVPST